MEKLKLESLAEMPGKKKVIILVLAVLAVNILLYINTVNYDFLKDDYRLIVENPRIKTFDEFTRSIGSKFFAFPDFPYLHYWRPMTLLTFHADYKLWGLRPAGYHLTNIIINALNALLIFYIFLQITSKPHYGFFAALFFSLHPCHVEAAAWISGRTDLLGALFILCAIFNFLKFLEKPDRWTLYFSLSMWSFILALLSKENSVLFPFFIMAMMFMIPKKEPGPPGLPFAYSTGKKLLLTLPFWFIDIVYIFIHNSFTGVQDVISQFSLSHIPVMIKTVGAYVKTIVFPFFPSPHFSMHRFDQANFEFTAYFFLGVLLLVLVIWKREHFRYTLFSLLFMIFILPVLDPEIVPSYPKIVIRFAYIPAVIAGVFFVDMYHLIKEQRLKKIFAGVLVVVGLIWSVNTVMFQGYFKDQNRHYSGLIDHDPDDGSLLLPYSLILAQEGKYSAALSLIDHALEVNEKDRWLDISEMGGLFKANLLVVTGKPEQGKQLATKILGETTKDEMKYFARLVISKYYSKQNNLPQAMAELDAAQAIGETSDLFYRKAVVAGKMSRFRDALAYLEKAYAMNPELPKYKEFKAVLLRYLNNEN